MKINNVAVDDLTPEQAAEIIRSAPTAAGSRSHTDAGVCVCVHTLTAASCLLRECQDALTMTVLRTMLVSSAGGLGGASFLGLFAPTPQRPQVWMGAPSPSDGAPPRPHQG